VRLELPHEVPGEMLSDKCWSAGKKHYRLKCQYEKVGSTDGAGALAVPMMSVYRYDHMICHQCMKLDAFLRAAL
jgi:hypothetical protein